MWQAQLCLRFQQLTAELVDVYGRICELRPTAAQDLAEPPIPIKKTLRSIQDTVSAEVGRLLRVIVNARRRTGAFDLEALEQATRCEGARPSDWSACSGR